MNRGASTTVRGRAAESTALNFLQKKGLHLVERNFNCKMGEIDLIMRGRTHGSRGRGRSNRGENIIFVEVRMRNNSDYGSAEETVTRKKQLKIIKTASYYLQLHPNLADQECRFDVITVLDEPKDNSALQRENINWIQDAFQTTEWV